MMRRADTALIIVERQRSSAPDICRYAILMMRYARSVLATPLCYDATRDYAMLRRQQMARVMLRRYVTRAAVALLPHMLRRDHLPILHATRATPRLMLAAFTPISPIIGRYFTDFRRRRRCHAATLLCCARVMMLPWRGAQRCAGASAQRRCADAVERAVRASALPMLLLCRRWYVI